MYCPECGTLTLRSYTHNAMPTYHCPRCRVLWAYDAEDMGGPCYRVLCTNWDAISEKPTISHLAPTKGEGPCHPPPTTS